MFSSFSFFLLLLQFTVFFFSINVHAQNQSVVAENTFSGFQPSSVFVIVVLAIMFFVTFILILYAKFCHRDSHRLPMSSDIHGGPFRSMSCLSGVDKKVVESLPFFRFSTVKGSRSREDVECAVCLARFEDAEILRLLPKCNHAFHVGCIDIWLEKHSTCPLCRQKITAQELAESFRFPSNRSEVSVESDLADGKAEELLVNRGMDSGDVGDESNLHRLLMKSRWSSVSYSDLTFLHSEMLHDESREKFTRKMGKMGGDLIVDIKNLPTARDSNQWNLQQSLCPTDKRSISEITSHSRFRELNGTRECSTTEAASAKEELLRRIWEPFARKTVVWFNDREATTSQTGAHPHI